MGWLAALVMVGAYVAYLGSLSLQQRETLYHFDEDLAIYDQIVWNTAHGRPFASTLIQHADTMLGDHFAPAVALFAPIYWVWPDARVLLLGQTLALALAALPLYAFARRRLGTAAALGVVAAYLLHPALHFVNLYQFHEIALLPLPLTLALLAVERGSRQLFWGATAIALTVKEEVALVVVGLGLLWWLRRRDWRAGITTAALGVAVGLLTMGVILPTFNTVDDGYYYVRRYAYLGNSPQEIALTALTSPDLVLTTLTSPERLRFLAQLIAPLALAPLLGWEYVVAASPVFGYLLLAESPDQYAINRHYLTPLLPFLFFGTVVGLERGAASVSRIWRTPLARPAALLAGLVLLSSGAASYLMGPTPLARGHDARGFAVTSRTWQLRDLIERVPPNAPVAASRNLLSWFSQRERVYRFPEVRDAEYVLVDWRDLRHPIVYQMDGGAFGDLIASPQYRLAASASGAVLFVRGDPFHWESDKRPLARFGEEVELLDARWRVLPSGSALEVTLTWRAVRRPARAYTVFVHLLDDAGRRIAQHDSWPLENLYPTDLWQPQRIVPDAHVLELPPSASLQGARLQIGLYDAPRGTRLPVHARGLPGGPDWVEAVVDP